MFAIAALHRWSRLWGMLPEQTAPQESAARRAMRYTIALGYLFELSLAALGMWRLGRQLVRVPWLWGLLLAGSVTALHAFYWADLRMRAPLVPLVALAAAAGLTATCQIWQRKSFAHTALATGPEGPTCLDPRGETPL